MEYAKTKSVITVQRNFRRQFEVDPPDRTPLSVGIHNSWRQVAYAKAKAPGIRRIRRRQWIEFGSPSYAAP